MLDETCNILDCDVYGAIKVIKNRWISVILISLKDTPKSFTQISKEFSFLSNAQLANSLAKMCEDKIITKDNKTYQITNSGVELIKILDQLQDWFESNM